MSIFAALPAIIGGAQAIGAIKGSKPKTYDESIPVVQPGVQFTSADPAQELAARQLQDLYFNPEYGLISQQIPVPVQQVAGLSPLEVQARNLAGGLGGFGQQLTEAQN